MAEFPVSEVYRMKDADGNEYDVPEADMKEFSTAVPQASRVTRYRDGDGQEYDVPDSDMGEFKGAVPDASPVHRLRFKSDEMDTELVADERQLSKFFDVTYFGADGSTGAGTDAAWAESGFPEIDKSKRAGGNTIPHTEGQLLFGILQSDRYRGMLSERAQNEISQRVGGFTGRRRKGGLLSGTVKVEAMGDESEEANAHAGVTVEGKSEEKTEAPIVPEEGDAPNVEGDLLKTEARGPVQYRYPIDYDTSLRNPTKEEREREAELFENRALDFAKNVASEAGYRLFTYEGMKQNAEDSWAAKPLAYINDLCNAFVAGLFGGSSKIDEGFGTFVQSVGETTGSEVVKDFGKWRRESAQADQRMLQENLPTDTLDTKGGGAVSKVLDVGKGVSGVTGEFLPALTPGVGHAYATALVMSGAVNRYANVFEEAINHGVDPKTAEGLAFGGASIDALGNMLLMGKFRGIWSGEQKALADAAKRGVLRRVIGDTMKTAGIMGGMGAWGEIIDEGAHGMQNPNWTKVAKVGFDHFIEGGLFHLVNSGAHRATHIGWGKDAKGIPAGAARDMLENPNGRALIFSNSPDAAAEVFRARRNGRDVSSKMIRDLGISEDVATTVADRNAIGDRLLADYDAFKARVRTKMDDVQASALADEIASRAKGGYDDPAFENIWMKSVEQIKDAREIDDPERRAQIVAEAMKDVLSESQKTSPNEGKEEPAPGNQTGGEPPKKPNPPESRESKPVEPSAGPGTGDGTPETPKPPEGGESRSVTSVRVGDVKPGESFTYEGKELYKNEKGEIVEVDVGKDGKRVERPTKRHFTGDELVDLPDRVESADAKPAEEGKSADSGRLNDAIDIGSPEKVRQTANELTAHVDQNLKPGYQVTYPVGDRSITIARSNDGYQITIKDQDGNERPGGSYGPNAIKYGIEKALNSAAQSQNETRFQNARRNLTVAIEKRKAELIAAKAGRGSRSAEEVQAEIDELNGLLSDVNANEKRYKAGKAIEMPWDRWARWIEDENAGTNPVAGVPEEAARQHLTPEGDLKSGVDVSVVKQGDTLTVGKSKFTVVERNDDAGTIKVSDETGAIYEVNENGEVREARNGRSGEGGGVEGARAGVQQDAQGQAAEGDRKAGADRDQGRADGREAQGEGGGADKGAVAVDRTGVPDWLDDDGVAEIFKAQNFNDGWGSAVSAFFRHRVRTDERLAELRKQYAAETDEAKRKKLNSQYKKRINELWEHQGEVQPQNEMRDAVNAIMDREGSVASQNLSKKDKALKAWNRRYEDVKKLTGAVFDETALSNGDLMKFRKLHENYAKGEEGSADALKKFVEEHQPEEAVKPPEAIEATKTVRVKDGAANAKRFKEGDKASFIEELATMSSRRNVSRVDVTIAITPTEQRPDRIMVSDGKQRWVVDADLLKTPEEMDAFLAGRRNAAEGPKPEVTAETPAEAPAKPAEAPAPAAAPASESPKKDLKTAVRELEKLRDRRASLKGTQFTGEDAQKNREENERSIAELDRRIEAAEAGLDDLREPSKPIPPAENLKPNPKKAAKVVADFASKDDTRKTLKAPYHDKKNGVVVATDGRILIATKHGFDPNAKEPEEGYPNWTHVVPDEKNLTVSIKVNPAELQKVCKDAIRLSRAVGIKDDGQHNTTPNVVLRHGDGTYTILSAEYLLTVAKAMEANGLTELRAAPTKKGTIGHTPLMARNADTTILIMPLRGGSYESVGRVSSNLVFDGMTGRIIRAPERTDMGVMRDTKMSEEWLTTLRESVARERKRAEAEARNLNIFEVITGAWKNGEKDPRVAYKRFNNETDFDSLSPENQKVFADLLNAGSEEELARQIAEYVARKMPDAAANLWVDKDPKQIAKIEKRIAAEDEVESRLMRDAEARALFGLEPKKKSPAQDAFMKDVEEGERLEREAAEAVENIEKVEAEVGGLISKHLLAQGTAKNNAAGREMKAKAKSALVDRLASLTDEEFDDVKHSFKQIMKENGEDMDKVGEIQAIFNAETAKRNTKSAKKPKAEEPAKPVEEKPAPAEDKRTLRELAEESVSMLRDEKFDEHEAVRDAFREKMKTATDAELKELHAEMKKKADKSSGEEKLRYTGIASELNHEINSRFAGKGKKPASEKRLTPETATVDDVKQIMADRWNEVHAKDANFKPMEPRQFSSTAEMLLKNIRNRNADGLISTLNGLNPASLRAFEVITGIKMPRALRDQHALIDKFCGITPEARAKIEAERKAASEAKYEAERRAQALADGEKIMKETRVRLKDGEVTTAQKLLEDGWTVKKVKRGAAMSTHLVAPDGSGHFKIDGKAFEYAEDFIAKRNAAKPVEEGKSFLPGGVIEARRGQESDEGPQPEGWRKLAVGKNGPVVLKVPDNETFKKFVEENYGKVVGEADVNAGGVEIEGGDVYNVNQILGHMAGATGKVEPMREGGKDETRPVPTRHDSGRYSESRPEGSVPQAGSAGKPAPETPAAPPTKDAVMAAAKRLGTTAFMDEASLRRELAETRRRGNDPRVKQRVADIETMLADREAKKPVNRMARAFADSVAANDAGDKTALAHAKDEGVAAQEALKNDIANGVPFPTEAEVEAAAKQLPERLRKAFIENMEQWRKYADEVRETPSIGDEAKKLADEVDAEIDAEETDGGGGNPAAPVNAPRGRGTGALSQDEPKSLGAGTSKKVVTPQTFLREAKSLFPDLAFRRKSTVRMPTWAAGHFEPANNLLRARDVNSIRTCTHELGHYIEHLTRYDVPKLPAVKRDLSDLGHALYGPGGPKPPSYIGEGFAEYVRGYVCNEPNLSTVAPDLHAWFNGPFKAKHPDIVKKLDRLRDMVQTMKEQSASQLVGEFMHPSTNVMQRAWKKTLDFFSGENWNDSASTILRGMKKSGIARLYRWQDDFRKLEETKDPAERARLAAEISDKIENHPYIFATVTRGTATQRVMDMARHGTTSLLGNRRTGESMKEIFADFTPAEREDWKKYAIARHGIENYFNKQMDFGIPRDVLEEVVRQYDSPKFQQALQRFTDYSHRILHLGVDAGLISQETYDKIVADHPIYVRITRRYDQDGAGTRQGGQAINRRTGGFDHILDPIDATLMDQEKYLRACFQAKTLQLIIRAGERARAENIASIQRNGGPNSNNMNPQGEAHNAVGAYWPVKVPNAQEKVSFSSGKLGEQLRQAAKDYANATGADPIPLEEFVKDLTQDNASLLTIFRDKPSYGKHNLVSVYVDGKLQTYELPDMKWANMLTDVYDKSDFNKLEKAFGLATAALRLGATTINPGFAVRNGIRDSLHSAVMSETGALPLLGSANGMLQQLLGKEAAVMFRSMGGHMSDLVGVTKEQKWHHGGKVALAQNAWDMAKAYKYDWLLMKPVVKACADVLSFPELGPRIREMSGVLSKCREAGLSEDAAAILAMSHAKDISIDFQRAGRLMKRINHYIPFSNAMWRGSEQLFRKLGWLPALPHQFEDRRLPGATNTILRGLAFITSWALPIALMEMSGDEKERRAAFERTPTEKWEYEHVGDWRFPLPFELGFIFGAIPKAAVYEMNGDEGAMKECLAAFSQAMPSKYASPDTAIGSISLISPWIGIMQNKDYRGRPIVPQHVMENHGKKNWYTSYTTELSKKLGSFFNTSPAQLEYVLDSYTGGLYRRMAVAAENVGDISRVKEGRGFSALDTLRARPQANRLVEDFYRFGEDAKRKLGDGEISLEEYGKYVSQSGVKKQLSEKFDEIRAIRTDKSIPLAEQDKRVNKIAEQANDIVRAFNSRDDYRKVGIVHAAVELTERPPNELDEKKKAQLLRMLKDVPRRDVVYALVSHGREMEVTKVNGKFRRHRRWSPEVMNKRRSRLLMLLHD